MNDNEIRARDAAQLLENPLLAEAINNLEIEAVAGWKATKAADTDARERIWMMVKAGERVRSYLEAIVNDQRISVETAKRAIRQPLP